MKNINWNEVKDEVKTPVPGGYTAKITRVEDDEQREFLKIEWEFVEGEFKGVNRETFVAFGFWPLSFVKSYKEKALRFFKGFKTAVENSNPGYSFNNDPQSLVGKFVGVVLGEEEYVTKKGDTKTRLYVAECRSGKAIHEGDFKIPALKKLDPAKFAAYNISSVPTQNYTQIEEDDGDSYLPF